MTIRTIIIIGTNYPDNIRIHTAMDKTDNKWIGFIYLLDDEEEIDRLLIDTIPVFDTQEDAFDRMIELCEWCVNYLKENEVFDVE